MDPFAPVTGSARIHRNSGRLPPYTPSTFPPLRPAATLGAGSPPSRPGTIPTRLLLLSDTHHASLFPTDDDRHAYKTPLPRADVLLHAGDLSNGGSYSQLRKTFDVLAAARAELKLVIAGNHDLTLDPAYSDQYLERVAKPVRAEQAKERARVHELWTGAEAKAAGIAYLDEGVHHFTLRNGARFAIYASPYSVEFMDWAFMYPGTEDRYNMAPIGSEKQPDHPIPGFPSIDIVMTHGPPHQILDRVQPHQHVGCPHLARALARVRPRLHVFGHIHEDWGAMRLDWDQGRSEYLDVGTGDDDEVVERGYVAVDVAGGRRKEAEDRRVEGAKASASETKGRGSMPMDELQWGKETLCINAAIMDARFRPMNAPWLVDLMLPAQEVHKI